MKDSGIDWIGKIPDEWKIEKGKRIFAQRNERGNKINLELLSPTQKYGVIPQTLYEELTTYSAVKLKEGTDLSQLKTVHKGDYCISLRSFQGGFEYSKYEGVVSPAYQIFYAIKNIDECYYKYLFKDQTFIAKMNSFTMSLRDGKNIAFSDFGNTYIPLPPLSEQTKIANFLDKKCAQIDSIIEESKKSIEEYKSWKQSVIFEAVTGKNLSCKKKDSGIDWISEIPENFIKSRIKHIATLAGRIGWQGLTSQEYSDEGCYLITGINFSNGEINWESCVRVPYSRWKEASQIQIENGDLLITKDGTVGKVAIVNNMPDKTSLNSGVLLIRQNKKVCSTRFLFWILQSNVFWKWFNYINAGNSTIIHLYQHDFSNFSFPNPSIEIQNEISNYLDAKCAQIDSLISEKQSLIQDLAEYKKSLIFEAVTGKRRV